MSSEVRTQPYSVQLRVCVRRHHIYSYLLAPSPLIHLMSSRGKKTSSPASGAAAVAATPSVGGKAPAKPSAGKRPMTDWELTQRRRLEKGKGSSRGITKPSLKRVARRAGVKHITAQVLKDLPIVIREFVAKNVGNAALYTQHSRRHTISCLDVTTALKHLGRPIYGFGPTR